MAGAYLAITCWTSSLTKSQVISFILSSLACFILVLLGWGIFSNVLSSYLPTALIDFIASLGFVSHFQQISRGVLDLRDVVYFASVMIGALALTVLTLNHKKAA